MVSRTVQWVHPLGIRDGRVLKLEGLIVSTLKITISQGTLTLFEQGLVILKLISIVFTHALVAPAIH